MTKNQHSFSANILFLYVTDTMMSTRFYAGLLDIKAVEMSEAFTLFILPSGLTLGLWRKDRVQPIPINGGGGEIGFKVENAAQIDTIHADWQAKGATIALPPTDLDFGRSFVALDPDGHRLRVYAIAGAI